MISPDHARTMAAYNRWQNRSLYGAADGLGEDARRADRGAFFGSIHATLGHILWADTIWMSRFAPDRVSPDSVPADRTNSDMDWAALDAAREAFDQILIDWTAGLDADWLAGDQTWYSGAAGRELSQPRWRLVTHLFNHQTHHRGQAHALLTAAGARPDDTDLFLMPA